MKILIVSTSDSEGGAARAAYRLHKALLTEDITSTMLVQSKATDDYTVIGPQTKFQKAISKLRPTLDSITVWRYQERTKALFSPNWLPFSDLVNKINDLNPDIVHLHWINSGMIRIEDFTKIKAPIVWSLHDNWAFTGGCHVMGECQLYKNSCGECPILGSKKKKDLSHKVWLRKKKTFAKLANIKIIGVSNWLIDCARQSSLFKDNEVICLPNPIDSEVYFPFDKFKARELLRLPQKKKLIGFGAMDPIGDKNKGFKELMQALEHLSLDYELVVFGSSAPQIPQIHKKKIHYLGHLYDDVSLCALYSAADVMVVPSLQEAFGQTASESLSCGTPVVAFGSTGLLDIVDHKLNGYLAQPFDIMDLVVGINWVLKYQNPEKLTQAARDKVLSEFDSKVVARKYISLYHNMLDDKKYLQTL